MTTPSWYDWEDGRLLLSMLVDSPRTRNDRHDPRIALTVLADSWYNHVSLLGRVVEIHDDSELVVLDRLSHRYWGEPYPKRELVGVGVWVEIDRWHSFGDPGAESAPRGS